MYVDNTVCNSDNYNYVRHNSLETLVKYTYVLLCPQICNTGEI